LKRPLLIALSLALLLSTCLLAVPSHQQASQNKSKAVSGKNIAGSNNEGEKRFRTNCGRCHNPPEGLSPREVRAVVRQMRVRAMLSAEDEKLILQYLAP
jgi:hypothetical protein